MKQILDDDAELSDAAIDRVVALLLDVDLPPIRSPKKRAPKKPDQGWETPCHWCGGKVASRTAKYCSPLCRRKATMGSGMARRVPTDPDVLACSGCDKRFRADNVFMRHRSNDQCLDDGAFAAKGFAIWGDGLWHKERRGHRRERRSAGAQ